MNFTREPIIETIITPKEGFKLSVRSSKGSSQEEYLVDSIEVVSFGRSLFFRSLEKPKSFLVPVSDYEVVEVKEARIALKNAQVERSIKIGGGREAPVRAQREAEKAQEEGAFQEESAKTGEAEVAQEVRSDRRRDRRNRRRRGGRDDRQENERWQERQKPAQEEQTTTEAERAVEGGGTRDETQVSSSIFSSLIPPPTTLISETIGKYKEKDTILPERDLLPESLSDDEEEIISESIEEEVEEDDEDDEGGSGSQGSHLSRVTSVTSVSYETNASFFGSGPSPFGRTFS